MSSPHCCPMSSGDSSRCSEAHSFCAIHGPAGCSRQPPPIQGGLSRPDRPRGRRAVPTTAAKGVGNDLSRTGHGTNGGSSMCSYCGERSAVIGETLDRRVIWGSVRKPGYGRLLRGSRYMAAVDRRACTRRTRVEYPASVPPPRRRSAQYGR